MDVRAGESTSDRAYEESAAWAADVWEGDWVCGSGSGSGLGFAAAREARRDVVVRRGRRIFELVWMARVDLFVEGNNWILGSSSIELSVSGVQQYKHCSLYLVFPQAGLPSRIPSCYDIREHGFQLVCFFAVPNYHLGLT